MLKLKPDPTFKVPVSIPAPGGALVIVAEYKYMTKDEYNKFIGAEKRKKRTDEEALMQIMVGWDDVDGPFNAENVHLLCQAYHGAASALVQKWIEELTQYKVGN